MSASPPDLAQLPPPPAGRSGWPWTEAPSPLPATMPDGSPWPRISIVTPSFNQGRYIEATIRSVLLQGYPNLEYFVVDGGSADESVAVIRRYAPWIDHWVSERDRGQSHAINKGLARSTGEIFNWINSDDLLMPGALAAVARASVGADAVAGAVCDFDQRGLRASRQNAGLVPRLMIGGGPEVFYHQPGLWLRPALIARCGGIDEQFQYAFDWDLTLRYLAMSPRVAYTPSVLAHFRLHEQSKTVSREDCFAAERAAILRKLSVHPVLGQWCRRRLRLMHWWSRLEAIRGAAYRSRWQQGAAILREICLDPQIRLSRLSLGALRRALQHHNAE